MFCSNCGSTVPDGTKFCPNCGAAVSAAPAQQPAAPAQPAAPQQPAAPVPPAAPAQPYAAPVQQPAAPQYQVPQQPAAPQYAPAPQQYGYAPAPAKPAGSGKKKGIIIGVSVAAVAAITVLLLFVFGVFGGKSQLLGTWYPVGEEGYVTFNADGTGVINEDDLPKYEEKFTYTLDGSTLTINYGGYPMTVTVTFSGDTMYWDVGYGETLELSRQRR